MSDRKALIRRWNKYHPINREVARHIQALEQQGESIWGRWAPIEMLDVLVLCLWAVEHPGIATRWWANDGDGGGEWLTLDSDYILDINSGWPPKTVMDFFKYQHGRDVPTDQPTHILDDLKEATDPLDATNILIEILSRNMSSFLYNHFISDKDDENFY